MELPQVPEMIFADNVLRVVHDDGYGIEFNALDALKCVDAHHDPLKVAVSQAWREARSAAVSYLHVEVTCTLHAILTCTTIL